ATLLQDGKEPAVCLPQSPLELPPLHPPARLAPRSAKDGLRDCAPFVAFGAAKAHRVQRPLIGPREDDSGVPGHDPAKPGLGNRLLAFVLAGLRARDAPLADLQLPRRLRPLVTCRASEAKLHGGPEDPVREQHPTTGTRHAPDPR